MNAELAWAAGFIDGEGTFGLQNKDRKNPTLYLSAGQVDREVLDRLQAALECGKVYGPYKPHSKMQQPYFYFKVTGAGARASADKLWPFLSSIKRAQYRRCI